MAPRIILRSKILRSLSSISLHPISISIPLRPSSSSSTVSTTSSNSADKLLAAQRRNRPIAPHLSIYKPQLTWCASGLNRITALGLSGAIYLYAIGYVAAPAFGWELDSASLAAAFAGCSAVTKGAVKTLVAGPFMYHSFNSLRHQMWDTGRGLGLKAVYRSGYLMIAATLIGTGWAVFFV